MAKSWRIISRRWLPRGETATWIAAACFAVTVGILSCGSGDGGTETLCSAGTRLLAAVLAQGLTLILPQLSGWLLDASARCLATTTTKVMRLFGLF